MVDSPGDRAKWGDMKQVIMFLLLLAFPLSSLSAYESKPMTAHNFTLPDIDGGALDMGGFRGKAILLVNTASYCGFTKQYDGLQALWETYRARGLVVLGVPSNDFGAQEPGSKDQIKAFCEVNFNIDFPMTDKLSVRGAAAHPLYKWLKAETGSTPKWNFHKFLIAPDGRPVTDFSSLTKPQSPSLIRAVEGILPN